MILFANIIAGLPSMVNTMIYLSWWVDLIVVVALLLLVVFIVFINDAERRIPIQYAKRVVGRKVYGGQSTNLPIKVSMSGVLPVIFAQSIVSIPPLPSVPSPATPAAGGMRTCSPAPAGSTGCFTSC